MKTGALSQQRTRRKVAIGSRSGHNIKPVVTRRCVDVFLSRLHPDTAVDGVESCTSDALQNIPHCDMSQININCTQLTGKHSFYTSFHVAVTVNSDLFAKAIEILMCGDSWPEGILVRRYFPKRRTVQDQQDG